jgi:hypothetical protein
VSQSFYGWTFSTGRISSAACALNTDKAKSLSSRRSIDSDTWKDAICTAAYARELTGEDDVVLLAITGYQHELAAGFSQLLFFGKNV